MLAKDIFFTQSHDYGSPGSFEQDISCIVSIGTGVSSARALGVFPTTIAKALWKMTTKTEQTGRIFSRDRSGLSDGGRYYQFNVPSGLDKIAREDSKRKKEIVAVTDRYLEDQETNKNAQRCAQVIRAKG